MSASSTTTTTTPNSQHNNDNNIVLPKQTTFVIINADKEDNSTATPTVNSYWGTTTLSSSSSSTSPEMDSATMASTSSAPASSQQPSQQSQQQQQQQPPLEQVTTATTDRSIVNLVVTEATLLSGNLDECYTAEDESCVAGVAAVSALIRHLAPPQQPVLVFPKFEKQSQFVQVHPLGWSVNRLILQGLLGWKVLMSTPSLLLQNAKDKFGSQHDLTYLQSTEFPFLLTNVAVPPSVSWFADYHEYIYYDFDTGIALLSIANSNEPLNIDAVDASWGALNEIAERNKQLGCLKLTPQEQERKLLFESYQEIYINGPSSNGNTNTMPPVNQPSCWIPVVYYDDNNLQEFIQGIMQHPHPPLFIVDVAKNAEDLYPLPVLVQIPIITTTTTTTTATTNTTTTDTNQTTTALQGNSTTPPTAATKSIGTRATMNATNNSNNNKPPSTNNTHPVWIHSFGRKDDVYFQHRLHLDLSTQPPTLLNVTLVEFEMEVLPMEYRDEIYAQHIAFLRQQADQALVNDPIVGYSTAFPVARDVEYRRCQGGECEVGNLFADALRWHATAHVAFVTAGGLRGQGWPAGPVHISNIWASVPFPNSVCTGIMSGKSLFQLVDYSIATATFEGLDSEDGDRLIQVSGMNIVYNTAIPKGQSRVVSIDVWDLYTQQYLPVERLSLYKFATDSYVCSAYDPFPELLGAHGNFTVDGEVPGSIGEALVQNVVADYLKQLKEPYQAAIQGRLVNNTKNFDILDMAETEETCEPTQYWSGRRGGCFPCPDSTHVQFSDPRIEFKGQSSLNGGIVPTQESTASHVYNATQWNVTNSSLFENVLQGRILLVNRELSNFSVVPKAIPSWLKFVENGQLSERFYVGGPTTALPSGSSLALDFVVGDDSLKSGTALGTVSFGILGRSVAGEEGIRSCDDFGRDATFDVVLQISPPPENNELGNFRYVGLSIMCLTLATAVFFGSCLYRYRDTAILKTMQPLFLVTICCGVFLMALTILPLSLDDTILSPAAANAACMATPWLLSMGVVIIFSALFSKLWRINQLFNVASFRRMRVTERDVLAPFALLFSVNTGLLTAWNVVDPLRSDRMTVEGEEWKTYSSCTSESVGYIFMYCVGAVNVAALLMACWQAYKARHISGEFAESRSVGLAVGCWLQVLLVGFPTLYLVDPEDIVASYFLQVGLLFVLCMSMMLIIFGPLVMMVFQYKRQPGPIGRGSGHVIVSGTSSQMESGSFYISRRSSVSTNQLGTANPRVSSNHKALQAMGAMRTSKRHSFAGHDEKSLKEMIAITAGVALPTVNSHGSGSEIEDSFNASKTLSVHDIFHDEEMGRNELEAKLLRKQVSAIDEGSESAFGSSMPSVVQPPQATEEISPSKQWADSIASITRPEQEITPQMLFQDLVPKDTAAALQHDSDSSVPFGGEGLVSEDDSDSSLPFQGSKAMLDDSSSTGDNSSDAGEPHDRTEEAPAVLAAADPLTMNPPNLVPRRPSKYSEHLLRTDDDDSLEGSRKHVLTPSVSISADSSSKSSKKIEFVPQVSDSNAMVVESRSTAQRAEIPFSSRFVDYKNRLSYVRNEDETMSTSETRARDASLRRMNDSSLTSMDDRSSRDKRGSFQMMNDYLVKSLRDCSEFHDSSIGASDHGQMMMNTSGRIQSVGESGKMRDRSGRFVTRREMTDDSLEDNNNKTMDRSVQSTNSSTLDRNATEKNNRSVSFLARLKGDRSNRNVKTSTGSRMRDHSDPGYYGRSDNGGGTSSRRRVDP